MSIGNSAPAWPSVIVSNGGISPSDHIMSRNGNGDASSRPCFWPHGDPKDEPAWWVTSAPQLSEHGRENAFSAMLYC